MPSPFLSPGTPHSPDFPPQFLLLSLLYWLFLSLTHRPWGSSILGSKLMVLLAMDCRPLSVTRNMQRDPSLNLSSETCLNADMYIQTHTSCPLLGTHRHTQVQTPSTASSLLAFHTAFQNLSCHWHVPLSHHSVHTQITTSPHTSLHSHCHPPTWS